MAEGQHKRFLGNVRGFVKITAKADGKGHRKILEPIDDRWPHSDIALSGGCGQWNPLLSIFDQRHH
jgi:hypothetical protein